MAYWCDDRALDIQQRELDAAQEDARRKLNDTRRMTELGSKGRDEAVPGTGIASDREDSAMVSAKGLLRDIAATLTTVIDRVDQVHDTHANLPEDVEAALDALHAASAILRRYR